MSATEAGLGREGFSRGDRITLLDTLFQSGGRAGELGVDSVVVDLDGRTGATAQCLATATLSGGQITAQGRILFTDDPIRRFSLAVTGGTGDYRTVGGEVRVEEDAKGKGKIALLR